MNRNMLDRLRSNLHLDWENIDQFTHGHLCLLGHMGFSTVSQNPRCANAGIKCGSGRETMEDVAFNMRINIVEPARGVEMKNPICSMIKSYRLQSPKLLDPNDLRVEPQVQASRLFHQKQFDGQALSTEPHPLQKRPQGLL